MAEGVVVPAAGTRRQLPHVGAARVGTVTGSAGDVALARENGVEEEPLAQGDALGSLGVPGRVGDPRRQGLEIQAFAELRRIGHVIFVRLRGPSVNPASEVAG